MLHGNRPLIVAFLVFWIVVALQALPGPVLPQPPQPVYAAGRSCPEVVQAALQAVDKSCASTARNNVCYGNVRVDVTPQDNAPKVAFAKPGDKAPLKNIQTLQLSSLTGDSENWGIALMRLQANLPDTAVGQNVTMLLFGNVQISDGTTKVAYPTEEPTIVVPPPTLPARTAAAQPTSKPTTTPRPSTTPKVPASQGGTQAANTGSVTGFKPMQAFYFSSGVGDPACKEAPQDGILIQSPQDNQKITLLVDEAKVVLGSTVFFQAQASKELVISTLEGSATVSAFGQVSVATAGSRVRVPIDANLRASGPPSPPEPFDTNTVQALPVQHMPQKIIPAAPIPTLAPGLHYTTWRITYSAPVITSGTSASSCTADHAPAQYRMLPIDAAGHIRWGYAGASEDGSYTLDEDSPVQGSSNGNTSHFHEEFRQTSPTHGEAFYTGVMAKTPFCGVAVHWQADLISGPTPSASGATPAATAVQ